MEKFLSRKFLVSVLVIVAMLLKQFLGVEISESQIEQVADAIVLLGTLITYIVSEAKVDAERAKLGR